MNHKTQNDPIKKQASVSEEERGSGLSPMAPPEVDSESIEISVPYEDMHPFLQSLMDEHREMEELIEGFEEALATLEKSKKFSPEQEKGMRDFLYEFDEEFVEHNQKEEKVFFPLLHRRLIEAGEHSKGQELFTGADILESEHIDGMKILATLQAYVEVFHMVEDEKKYQLLLTRFIKLSRSLIESLRTHIQREDNVIFGLSMKLLSPEDFEKIEQGHL